MYKVDSDFYHEKQSTMKCAIHAVNNLLRSQRYKKDDFDKIAKELYDKEQASKSSEIYINPYKNIFGLGNYDVSVIEVALLKENYQLKWWDMRKDFSKFDFMQPPKLMGFLINDRGKKGIFRDFFKIVQPNHWFSVLKSEDAYFNVDSRLDEPVKFKNQGDFIKLMKDIQKNDGFIFPVYRN